MSPSTGRAVVSDDAQVSVHPNPIAPGDFVCVWACATPESYVRPNDSDDQPGDPAARSEVGAPSALAEVGSLEQLQGLDDVAIPGLVARDSGEVQPPVPEVELVEVAVDGTALVGCGIGHLGGHGMSHAVVESRRGAPRAMMCPP